MHVYIDWYTQKTQKGVTHLSDCTSPDNNFRVILFNKCCPGYVPKLQSEFVEHPI